MRCSLPRDNRASVMMNLRRGIKTANSQLATVPTRIVALPLSCLLMQIYLPGSGSSDTASLTQSLCITKAAQRRPSLRLPRHGGMKECSQDVSDGYGKVTLCERSRETINCNHPDSWHWRRFAGAVRDNQAPRLHDPHSW